MDTGKGGAVVNEPGGEPGAGSPGQGRPPPPCLPPFLPLRPRGSSPGSQEARRAGPGRLEAGAGAGACPLPSLPLYL